MKRGKMGLLYNGGDIDESLWKKLQIIKAE